MLTPREFQDLSGEKKNWKTNIMTSQEGKSIKSLIEDGTVIAHFMMPLLLTTELINRSVIHWLICLKLMETLPLQNHCKFKHLNKLLSQLLRSHFLLSTLLRFFIFCVLM